MAAQSTRGTATVVAGTVVLLAAIGAVVYLISTDRPVEVAISFMGPIVLAVLAGAYNATQLERVEGKLDRIGENTNGVLDRRIRDGVRDVLGELESMERLRRGVRDEDSR